MNKIKPSLKTECEWKQTLKKMKREERRNIKMSIEREKRDISGESEYEKG